MVDFLVQATISNLIVSAVLAGLAWAFQRSERSVVIANLLWTVVLLKMVTPPLFSLPMIEVGNLTTIVQANGVGAMEVALDGMQMDGALGPIAPNGTPGANSAGIPLPTTIGIGTFSWIQVILLTWLAVSVFLLLVSLFRIAHFEILLRGNSRLPPKHIKHIAKELSRTMGLRKTPLVMVSDAHIAPFVWWLGGRARIILSESASRQLNDDELGMVLAHEMAHLQRRDHWIRWVECLAGVIAWWNPLLWWTRRHLRTTEEVACDELVIENLGLERGVYANTLLNMAELLSTSASRPPAVASGINSGGSLEQRLTKIMFGKNILNPSWLRPAIMVVAMCIAPFGLVYAQDYEAVERILGGAVEDGELTIDQAKVMLDALKKTPGSDKDLVNTKQAYMDAAKKIEQAVKAGKMTKQDAEKKLIALRKKMFPQNETKDRGNRDIEAQKRKYMEVVREFERAVKDGKVSEQDAEKNLVELREKMFRRFDSQAKERDLENRKREYLAVARDIEIAVKDGKLNKDEAKEKLDALRKDMFRQSADDRDDPELEERKREHMELAREIEQAVKAGKLSKDEAKEKLNALRKDMFRKSEPEVRKDPGLKDRKRKYMAIAREIEIAVKDGKMNKDEAEEKLIALRKEMFRQGDSDDRE